MSAIAELVVQRFLDKPDTKSIYGIRYDKAQKGQIEYAQSIANMFPTPPAVRAGRFQRTDAVIAATFADEAHVVCWRKAYEMMPTDAVSIVARWLAKMLSNDNDDSSDLKAAACFLFASRSTIEYAPSIETYCGLLCACWLTTEKTGVPRLIPLVYDGLTKQVPADYERLARVLPKTTQWSAYTQVHDLLDKLGIPRGARKNNLPRVMLIGLLDVVQWRNSAFDALMSKLPQGRADLFNLALGHVSRSYLLWPYMGMTVRAGAAPTLQSQLVDSRQVVPYRAPTTSSSSVSSEPLFIPRQLAVELDEATAQLLELERRTVELRERVAKLHETATVQALRCVPSPAQQSTSCGALPDVLTLSDDENASENSGIVEQLTVE